MAQDLAYSYAAITKSEKQVDGTLKVYGKATDDSIDIDKQICDDAWLKRAMPDWFVSGGNIREQHSSIAAGVATDYEYKSDGHYITALIVDPTSVKKIENGVLKGFSIGIRGPRVIRDEKAAGGRIVDGQIVEISVVDRPANSNAKMTIAKAVDGELVAVEQTLEELVIPTPADIANKFNENHDESGRFSAGDGSSSISHDSAMSQMGQSINEMHQTFVAERPDHSKDPVANLRASGSLAQARSSFQSAQEAHAAGDHATANAEIHSAADSMRQASEHYANAMHSTPEAQYQADSARGAAILAANAAWTHDQAQAGKSGKSAVAEEGSIVPEEIVKFNENHDEAGRFSSGDGAGGSTPHYSAGYGTGAEAAANYQHIQNAYNHVSDATQAIRNSPDHIGILATTESHNASMRVGDANTAFANGDRSGAASLLHEAAGHLENVASTLGAGSRFTDVVTNGAASMHEIANAVGKLPNVSTAPKSAEAESTIDKSAELLNTVGTLLKFDQATYDAACGALYDLIAIEAAEGKAGSDERDSIKELLGAIKHLYEWYEGEVSEGEVAMPNPEIADDADYDTIELSADSDKMCDKCGESDLLCKCDSMKSADAEETPAVETPAEPEAEAEPVEEETLVETTTDEATEETSEVDRLKSALDAEIEKATRLEAELELAKSAVVVGGPRRSAITKAVNTSEVLVKATEYRNKAAATTDRVLREGYEALAADLEKSLKGQK